MRAVYIADVEKGVVELNYLWLPTYIGMNSVLKDQMEKELAEKVRSAGLRMDSAGLDTLHEWVCNYLVEKLPYIKGLGRYLDAMKYLES